MGVSQHSLLTQDDHETGLNDAASTECQGVKRHVVSRRRSSARRAKRIVMKKRRLKGASRRNNSGIIKRVKTLKRLVPSGAESPGLDGLFRDTADYILSLQTRVRVMQIMVKVLSGSEE